jgi:plastocyanin
VIAARAIAAASLRAAPVAHRVAAALAAAAAWTFASAATHEVTIRDYRFTPAEITIKVGDIVRWTSREKRASHSVFFEAGKLPESDRLFLDESWERRFDVPGRYPYHCGPHPEMQGVVHVD